MPSLDHSSSHRNPLSFVRAGVPVAIALSIAAGCAPLKVPGGIYRVTAVDASGKELPTAAVMTDRPSQIYMMRNAMCINHPGAVVTSTGPSGAIFEEAHRCPNESPRPRGSEPSRPAATN